MKRNAIVVASIMFAASAANRAADQTPSLAQQYDPAYRVYHADSSSRGGSNEAHGYQRNTGIEKAPTPIDPLVQADSSIRGGSKEARSQYHFYANPFELVPEPSLQGSANWNPSDDLLPDGILNKDASIGGAATSQSTSEVNGSILDDTTIAVSPEPATGGALNSSEQLEKNITGEFNLSDQGDQRVADQNSSTAVGGPGSTQTGTGSSSPEAIYNQASESNDRDPGDNSQASRFLFRNNRAQGVGSASTGDYAIVSGDLLTANSDQQLSARVKSSLAHESTGIFGLTQSDLMHNIQVSSHGGTVFLKGTVPTEKDKRMIEIRTREISGVNRVDNQLTVTAAPKPALRDLKIGRDLEDTTDQLKKLNEHED